MDWKLQISLVDDLPKLEELQVQVSDGEELVVRSLGPPPAQSSMTRPPTAITGAASFRTPFGKKLGIACGHARWYTDTGGYSTENETSI